MVFQIISTQKASVEGSFASLKSLSEEKPFLPRNYVDNRLSLATHAVSDMVKVGVGGWRTTSL